MPSPSSALFLRSIDVGKYRNYSQTSVIFIVVTYLIVRMYIIVLYKSHIKLADTIQVTGSLLSFCLVLSIITSKILKSVAIIDQINMKNKRR